MLLHFPLTTKASYCRKCLNVDNNDKTNHPKKRKEKGEWKFYIIQKH